MANRLTINENIIDELVNNRIEVVRFLLYAGKHCLVARIMEEKTEGYRGINPGEETGEDEYIIDFLELKQYGVMKVKTNNKIKDIIDDSMEVLGNYFNYYSYDEHPTYNCESVLFQVTDKFKDSFNITENILGEGDNYIDLDLDEFNQLRSKYDVYLYLKLKRFATTGNIILSYKNMEELFGDTSRNITRRLKQSAEKLELILGKKIYVKNPEVKNRKSTTLTITFKAEQKETKEPKEIVKNKRKSKAKEEKTKRMLDF